MSLFHELLTDPDDSYLTGDCLLEGYNQGANFYTDDYTEGKRNTLTNRKAKASIAAHRRNNGRRF